MRRPTPGEHKTVQARILEYAGGPDQAGFEESAITYDATLPTRKVGGRRVVHVLDLAAWLGDQRVALDGVPMADSPRRRPGRPTKAKQRRAR